MHALSPTDYLSPSGFGKKSLLRRLFPSPKIGLEHISAVGEEEEVVAAAAKTVRLNAIWSQTVLEPIDTRVSSLGSHIVSCDAVDEDGDDDYLVNNFPYLSTHNSSDVGQTASHVSPYMPYPVLGMTTRSESTTEHPVTITRCFGAIVDGFRRRCPSTSPSNPPRVVDQISGVSVNSSAIAHITEVAYRRERFHTSCFSCAFVHNSDRICSVSTHSFIGKALKQINQKTNQ
ncbi:hypothetical protein FGIG_04899 [Fasciola gigantica]|uniref:Uncharacterized protein n=1 Tax=Fasciola gigantica TaxID=46835 RepID=A0A504YNE8_FASGI|nr:hypothetical protein FGIG_04899 [Fasciola gigantica]